MGIFIREKREALSLSQRALGQLFEPPVTTQFISNIERGVTPLPPGHVPTLARALRLDEADLLGVMEREYAAKISQRAGRASADAAAAMRILEEDRAYFQALYDAYRGSDPAVRSSFHSFCETLFRIAKPVSKPGSRG